MVMTISKKIIILFLIITVLFSFHSKYTELIREFESTAMSKQALVNEYISLSSHFIEGMTVFGNNFFLLGVRNDQELYRLLKYSSDQKGYNLDAVAGTKYENSVGSLTGLGRIPESGVDREELNLALYYNEYFKKFILRLPDLAWLYYTSEKNFINIFPWVPSKEFTFAENLKSEVFYKNVNPKNNPLRKFLWTPAYLDHAGKGLMVTLSSPIYDKDTFKGVVSLDLTLTTLSKMIMSEYESCLFDETGSILASSFDVKMDKKLLKFEDLMKVSPDELERMKRAKKDTVQFVGKYYIYSSEFKDAPWRMFFFVPVWLVIGQAMLFTFPILLLCILLSWTVFEVDKRKKTESQLGKSLEELRKYQKLLENAAKYDFLTNTVNRRGLKEIFNKSVDVTGAEKVPISFIMGDIDYFKNFNDTFGHAAGDKVLVEIANLIRNSIKSNDVVCRWGGEEFILMLLETTYDEALLCAEDIRRKIEAVVIPWKNGRELRVTMSFGVAGFDYDESIDVIISKADSALYVCKKSGRNRVVGDKECKIL